MSDSPIVTLRGQRSDDADTLYAIVTQTDVVYFSGELPYMSDDAFRERFANNVPGLYRLIGEIVLPSGRNRFVGLARLQTGAARQRHVGELEILLHPDYQNTAEAESFLAQVVAYAERWLALRRLQVTVYADDTRGLALFEKLHFEREATLRRYGFRDGAYRAAYMLARLAPEREIVTPKALADDEDDVIDDDAATEHAPLEEIVVRGAEAADWEDVADIFACESVYANTLQLPYLSRDGIRDRFENIPEDVHMLVAEADERVVGVLGVHLDAERHPHVADIGMMVHENYQGCGVGSALMAAAVELCERWRNISRIALEVYVDNAAGLGLYQKFGFEIEGTLREFAYRDGQFVDTYAMARVREDGQR